MNFLLVLYIISNYLIIGLLGQQICEIKLLSVRDNEVFNHQVVLLRGRINCKTQLSVYPNSFDSKLGRFVTVQVGDSPQNSWPVNSYNEFKAVIRLKPGFANKVGINYRYSSNNNLIESSSLVVNLKFEDNKKQRAINLAIFVAKDSPLTFDMDIESRLKGEKNDLDSAIQRIRTAGLLFQAFTSDILNSYNLSRNSFRLALNSQYGSYCLKILNISLTFLKIKKIFKLKEPIVNILKSKSSLQDLRNAYNNPKPNELSDLKLYDEIHNTILESTEYLNESYLLRQSMVFGVLILDSHWDAMRKRVELHAARGSGWAQPR